MKSLVMVAKPFSIGAANNQYLLITPHVTPL
jgi:hypothetical protein